MLHRCSIELLVPEPLPRELADALVRRAAACARSRGVTLLAWGLRRAALRLVLDGAPEAIERAIRVLRAGTTQSLRAWDRSACCGEGQVAPVDARTVHEAIAWAHQSERGGDPLANPWSSHRDLLGYRSSHWFDAAPARRRVSPLTVHRLAGGGALPVRGAPRPTTDDVELDELLRVAAAVHGVLPSDRRSFRLFVHLGRALGWTNRALAGALAVTERRIRQLLAAEEPLLDVAVLHVVDPRLARVP